MNEKSLLFYLTDCFRPGNLEDVAMVMQELVRLDKQQLASFIVNAHTALGCDKACSLTLNGAMELVGALADKAAS